MSNGIRDLRPTPSAVLELKEERQLVREGYDFLDEKRLLLASELLRELSRYRKLLEEYLALHDTARQAVAYAMIHHGLHGLQVYPPDSMENAEIRTTSRSYLGVTLVESEFAEYSQPTPPVAEFPTPEAEQCREVFAELLRKAAVLGAISGNLFRLVAEYRRTERRAKALEDVLLPEIEEALRTMQAQLEDADLEEVIRTRLKCRS